ncbi:MAG: DUF4249 family protein [bacterium]
MRISYYSTARPFITHLTCSVSFPFSIYFEDAYFDDALFDGEFYDLDISFYNYSEPIEMFIVVLLTTSESYYNFHKSVDQQNATEDNPFAEPVPIYTNIENGLGVFAGYSSFVYPLR